MMDEKAWKAKLAAWIHDPAEKALVLLRDAVGHEGGTVANLSRELGFEVQETEGFDGVVRPRPAFGADIVDAIRRADRWAAAADRPQWPRDLERRWADQVRFADAPVLVHALSGRTIRIKDRYREIDLGSLKEASFDAFASLIQRCDDDKQTVDYRRTMLAFWRFGPERAPAGLGSLWRILPADTRVPDHSIWSHLGLTSAFAGIFASGDRPALLLVSLGPVQGFIAQARTTSDLWAGSHLLSHLAWAAMRPIAEQYGPDAILFPQLRGIPAVDVWLRNCCGLDGELFRGLAWMRSRSDANPLFGAALTNRFLAVVPASQMEKKAREIEKAVRRELHKRAHQAACLLFGEARTEQGTFGAKVEDVAIPSPMAEQIDAQLKDFPEVHWSGVPWGLAREREDGSISRDGIAPLQAAVAAFRESGSGFFDSAAWRLLSDTLGFQGAAFFRPNPGVLYPPLYEVADRSQAALKGLRAFRQAGVTGRGEMGYRCSLCGEREWLTEERDHLNRTRRERVEDRPTWWTRLSHKQPSLARSGEHLCALCATKRAWPRIFEREVADFLAGEEQGDSFAGRFVVSTHALALAPNLAAILERREGGEENVREPMPITAQIRAHRKRAALPKRLAEMARKRNDETGVFVRNLVAFIEDMRDARDGEDPERARQAEDCLKQSESLIRALTNAAPEAYYGVLRLDGDRLGAWLSASEEEFAVKYGDRWHPDVRRLANELAEKPGNEDLGRYLELFSPPSPGRHGAISEALNAFALELACAVVEDCFKGRLVYAGGDDALALMAVDDLLPAALALRLVYSGVLPGQIDEEVADAVWAEDGPLAEVRKRFRIGNGYVFDRRSKRLFGVMGERATASAGLVIAHHMTPLSRVIREAKAAEHRAKHDLDRDGFSITVMKRAGGDVRFSATWSADWERPLGVEKSERLDATPAGLLLRVSSAIRTETLSRRVPYHIVDWVEKLPVPGLMQDARAYRELLAANLGWQLRRQSAARLRGQERVEREIDSLADGLAKIACAREREGYDPRAYIAGFFRVAEYLARGLRATERAERVPAEEERA